MNQKARERLWHHKIDSNGTTLRTLIRTGGWAAAAYFISRATEKLAGQVTVVDLATQLVLSASASMTVTLSITAALLGSGWGALERYLRHRKVAQMSDRIRELELRLDPQRSTSGLTKHGKTNPKDVRR